MYQKKKTKSQEDSDHKISVPMVQEDENQEHGKESDKPMRVTSASEPDFTSLAIEYQVVICLVFFFLPNENIYPVTVFNFVFFSQFSLFCEDRKSICYMYLLNVISFLAKKKSCCI